MERLQQTDPEMASGLGVLGEEQGGAANGAEASPWRDPLSWNPVEVVAA